MNVVRDPDRPVLVIAAYCRTCRAVIPTSRRPLRLAETCPDCTKETE